MVTLLLFAEMFVSADAQRGFSEHVLSGGSADVNMLGMVQEHLSGGQSSDPERFRTFETEGLTHTSH